MKIDDKINKIKPYILSIRYQDNLSIVDVKLKEGWQVPQSPVVGVEKYAKAPNTYMFYSNDEEIVVDDIIDFIDGIVKINIERERKMELLSQKKNELTTFFVNHTLAELERLSFVIEGESAPEPMRITEDDTDFPFPPLVPKQNTFTEEDVFETKDNEEFEEEEEMKEEH